MGKARIPSKQTGVIWEQDVVEVPAGNTEIIDSSIFANFRSIKYIFSAYNVSQDLSQMYEVSAVRKSNDVKDHVSGRLGEGISLKVEVVVDTGNVLLKVTNNETFLVTINYAKLIFTV